MNVEGIFAPEDGHRCFVHEARGSCQGHNGLAFSEILLASSRISELV